MAKTIATGSETPAKKPATRKPAAKTVKADVKQEGGATAPVSLPVDQAATSQESTAPAAIEQQAPAIIAPSDTPTGVIESAASQESPVTPTAAAESAPVEPRVPQVPPRGFFSPIGRFPEDWTPALLLPHELEQPAPIALAAQGPELDDEGEQTAPEEPAEPALKSSAWGLPDITEFPAELTLVNNTRHLLVVRPLAIRVGRFGEATATCPSARHYAAIQHDFAGRAVREQWDSETGLQVKHGDDQG